MDIATPEMLRALEYVRVLTESGIYPSMLQLRAYSDALLPSTVLEDYFDSEVRLDLMSEQHYEVVSSVGDYLKDVGWVALTTRGLELTRIGAAVLANTGPGYSSTKPVSTITVVLKGNDPVSYSALIEAVQRVSNGSQVLLIDPYLPSSHLKTLAQYAGISQLLTSEGGVRDSGETKEDRTKAFALAQGAFSKTGLDVRYASKGSIHDRLVLPAAGPGLLIGRSLGGRQLTAVVELDEDTAATFRHHYAPAWQSATRITPADLSHLDGDSSTSE